MCSIAAIVAPRAIAARVIRDMADRARHRGPDDEGYALFAHASAAPELVGGHATPPDAFTTRTPFAPGGLWQHDDRPVSVALGHRRLSIIDVSVLGHQPMSTPDRRYWLTYNGEIYNYCKLAGELIAAGHCFTSQCDTEVI